MKEHSKEVNRGDAKSMYIVNRKKKSVKRFLSSFYFPYMFAKLT